jgi:murein DD-endopeptidase MepM/ murein hydrolase activator NlpD
MGDARVAALQVALHEQGLYTGTIDGVAGTATASAVMALESKHGLRVDGVPGPELFPVLGRYAPRTLGSRILREGMIGADVAQAQWELAWRGFPSGAFDGRFGLHLDEAVHRFQRWAGFVAADGVVGPATVSALVAPSRVRTPKLAAPIDAPVGDRFGPRGDRFHAGVDFVAAVGTPVAAAAPGRVVWVGVRTGWGLVVTVAHGGGVRTMYAHLSKASVRLGQRVAVGARVGLVGKTGDATGPHLHFEVRLRGAAIDPLSTL